MTNTCRALSTVAICVATCAPWFNVRAQARQVGIAYEHGVNAYFAGRPCEAESFLSLAIEENSQDPRAYYFRALSLLRQGRVDLARGDMLTGAMLEAEEPQRYAIGSALERVQGPTRLMLEEFRRHARLNVTPVSSSPATMPPQAPNRTFREGESDVLREKTFVPLEELLRPEGPRSIAVEPAVEQPVVPPQAGTPAAGPDSQPTAPPATAPSEVDPFADDSQRAAPNAAPAPMPPIPPQEGPKPATPPTPEVEDPFGG